MTRKYAELWARIANKEAVTVRCHVSNVRTITKALQQEKWRHKAARRMTDLPSFGQMLVTVAAIAGETKFVRVTFTLSYSGDNL